MVVSCFLSNFPPPLYLPPHHPRPYSSISRLPSSRLASSINIIMQRPAIRLRLHCLAIIRSLALFLSAVIHLRQVRHSQFLCTFWFPSFSLPFPSQLFPNIGETLGNITMVFIVLCSPWFATAQLERVTNQTRGESKKVLERECKSEESLKGLLKERDNALEELMRNREDLERLKEEAKDQMKAWEEKERDWEEKRTREEEIHGEDKRSLEIGRNKERASRKGASGEVGNGEEGR